MHYNFGPLCGLLFWFSIEPFRNPFSAPIPADYAKFHVQIRKNEKIMAVKSLHRSKGTALYEHEKPDEKRKEKNPVT